MNIISEPEENYKTGWIKIFRSLENHWVWSNEKYFKAWVWFLFRANHKSNKILFSGELIDINRGEFLTSLKSISEASKLSIQEARHFLSLLEKDKMIFKISNTQSTKITICNYDTYQELQQTNNTPTTNEQHTNNKRTTTDKNEKELNNEKELKIYNSKFDFKQSIIDLGVELSIVLDWLIVRKNKKASNTETAFNKLKREIEKSKLNANECIKIAVEKNWCGFESEWLNNIKLDIKNSVKKGNNIPKGGW